MAERCGLFLIVQQYTWNRESGLHDSAKRRQTNLGWAMGTWFAPCITYRCLRGQLPDALNSVQSAPAKALDWRCFKMMTWHSPPRQRVGSYTSSCTGCMPLHQRQQPCIPHVLRGRNMSCNLTSIHACVTLHAETVFGLHCSIDLSAVTALSSCWTMSDGVLGTFTGLIREC